MKAFVVLLASIIVTLPVTSYERKGWAEDAHSCDVSASFW